MLLFEHAPNEAQSLMYRYYASTIDVPLTPLAITMDMICVCIEVLQALDHDPRSFAYTPLHAYDITMHPTLVLNVSCGNNAVCTNT